MKRKILVLFLLLSLFSSFSVSGCTGFTASNNNKTLVGNNEDWCDPFTFISIYPPSEGSYGRIYFEAPWPPLSDMPNYLTSFGGMNDQGLFYDQFSHPYLEPQDSIDKPIFPGELDTYCLEKCATVNEVLEIYNQYNLYFLHSEQQLWIDRTGASVIIEGDDIIYKEGDFQVVTNFLHSHPELGGYMNAFGRYNTVVGMLENMTDLSVNYFKSVCNETHSDDFTWSTKYSNICDLNNGIVYLYYYHDFEKCVQMNLSEEFQNEPHSYFLPLIFESVDNLPPAKTSAPTGEISGKPKHEYNYRVNKTIDPDGDNIMYLFDWGDGTNSGWIPPTIKNNIIAKHSWNEKGVYEIKVKARDIYGAESEWSDPLKFSTPKNKLYINPVFLRFLETYLQKFPLMRFLLKLNRGI